MTSNLPIITDGHYHLSKGFQIPQMSAQKIDSSEKHNLWLRFEFRGLNVIENGNIMATICHF